jgi:hypothetical protein
MDTRTLELKSFFDEIPPYAILSHCWEEEEVILSDLDDLERAKAKKGFSKIEKTCAQALKDGLDYCWLDQCCIDKSSSAELSEAINSMFDWYQRSSKCYAYLSDVEGLHDFAKSKWFTRAWTLQELLAPSSIQPNEKSGMDFFSRDWKFLGTKGRLSRKIASITGVAKEYLEGLSLAGASISMRMSWAADRRATRAEDIAYSLLGLFDVNMPLLYGEGKLKAFRRLQEEIMKISEDETLFAWESVNVSTDSSSAGVLAQDPKDFWEARHMVPFASDAPLVPYTMTHRGLRIWLSLFSAHRPRDSIIQDLTPWIKPLRSPIMIWSSGDDDLLWGALRCHVAHDFHNTVVIPLRRLNANSYARDTSTNVALITTGRIPPHVQVEEAYIRNSHVPTFSNSFKRRYGFLIRNLPPGFSIAKVLPMDYWDSKGKILQGDNDASVNSHWHASIQLDTSSSTITGNASFFIRLGCKPGNQAQGDVHPEPSSFVEDTLQSVRPTTLESFQLKGFSHNSPAQVLQFRDATGTQHNFRLKVSTPREKIFGQWMFVVDVDFTKEPSGLDVPERTSWVDTATTNSISRLNEVAVGRPDHVNKEEGGELLDWGLARKTPELNWGLARKTPENRRTGRPAQVDKAIP